MGSTNYRWLIAIDTPRNSLVVPGKEAQRKDHLLAAALGVLEPSAHGKHLPVGAEKGRQDPGFLVTSAILGGGEGHSHIAPKKFTFL